ncbi:MAG: hypothetical protein QOJ49_84, partial [Actinomycetota bacterium]|nr:hypothetical protein [Actinomycetota bacterium]
MSREQRVGQLLAVGLADNRVGRAERLAIRSDHLGTVWFVHKSTAG